MAESKKVVFITRNNLPDLILFLFPVITVRWIFQYRCTKVEVVKFNFTKLLISPLFYVFRETTLGT